MISKQIRKKNRARFQKRKNSSESSISEEPFEDFWASLNSQDVESRIVSSLYLIHVKNLDKLDLCSNQSIQKIIERLNDNDCQVQFNILNGIQNLIQNKKFYDNLQQFNFIQIFLNLIKNDNLFLNQEQINNKIKIISCVFDLCSAFCEISDNLLKWQEIFDQGLGLLQQTQDFELIEKILDFINVLTESDLFYCQKIIQSDFYNKLVQLVQNFQIPQQINSYIAFILYNIQKNLQQVNQQIIEIIFMLIQKQMQIKIIDEVLNLKTFIQQNVDQSQQAIILWKNSFKSVQVIFFLLLTIFENEEEDYEDELEIDMDQQQQIEQQQDQQKQQEQQQHQIQQILQSKLLNEQLIIGILNNLKITKQDDLNFLENDEQYFNDSCIQLNELSLSFLLNIQDKQFNQLNYQINQILWQQIQNQQNYDVLLLSLKLFYRLMQNSTQIEIQTLFNQMKVLIDQQQEEEIQLVIIDIISYRFQPKFQISQQENLQACDFFISLLQNQNIMIASQALNGIFDIFQNEDYDQNFKNRNLLMILQQGCVYFQNKLQIGQKNHGYLKDCLKNLKRFIKYKQDNLI